MSATKLTFDDIDTSAGGGVAGIPDGYGGLTWSDSWGVAKPKQVLDNDGDGYFTGNTSGKQVAYTVNAAPVEISATKFNFQSVELTAGWDTSLSIEVVAHKGDKVVYDQTISLSDSGPFLFDPNLKGITDITFTPGSGTHDPNVTYSGSHIVFDDLKVSKVVSLDDATAIDGHHAGSTFADGMFTTQPHMGLMHTDAFA